MSKLNHLKRFNESDEKLKQSGVYEVNNEYAIINKTAIEKRIEELKPKNIIQAHEVSILKQILSQSTPLTSEIEKSIGYGFNIGGQISKLTPKMLQDYISNLKLDL